MNKKKVGVLAAAGLMTVGVVGGTLAWFTSWDSVTNVFYTGKNGVEIYEYFNSPSVVVPGDVTPKLVQIKNTANYDSFIRVKFNRTWADLDGNVDTSLSTENIILNFTDNVVEYKDGRYSYVNGKEDAVESVHGKWIKSGDYYYYVGRVPGTPEDDKTPDISFTNTLLESVTLLNTSDNDYRDKKFNVEVIAESIQADNNAYESLNIQDPIITDLLATYSDKDKPSLDAGYEQAKDVTTTGEPGSIRDYVKAE